MSLAPFAKGDIFVTDSALDDSARFPTGMGKVRQYDAEWSLKATYETGQRGLISSLSLDRSGRLHIFDPQARWVGTIGPDGQPLASFPELPNMALGSMIETTDGFLFGETFIGAIPGFAGAGHVYRVDHDGRVIRAYDTANNGGVGGFLGVTHMALSPDASTLYHVSETGAEVYAHDLADDRRLGAIYTRQDPPPMVFGLATAPDGSVLVACATEIRRLSPQGEVIQTYALPEGRGWSVVKMRHGDTAFWALDFMAGQLVCVGLASGEIAQHKQLGLAKCLAGIAEYQGSDEA